MADELMYIIQIYHFCTLWLVVETFGHSIKWTNQSKLIKVPKVLKQTNEKTLWISEFQVKKLVKLWEKNAKIINVYLIVIIPMKFRSRRYVAMSKEGHPMEPKHILKISTDSGFTNVASGTQNFRMKIIFNEWFKLV